jgi:hypothetical protein
MTTEEQRQAIVDTAQAEAKGGGVFAKKQGLKDPNDKRGRYFRLGYEKLLKYFRVSVPKPGKLNESAVNEEAIKYLSKPGELSPMPHWCGIFALWAIKSANITTAGKVGTWVVGQGISNVPGFRQVSQAYKGDVGFVKVPHQHHFIIEDVIEEGGIKKVKTIEGNSALNSEFSFKTRAIHEISGFYSIF